MTENVILDSVATIFAFLKDMIMSDVDSNKWNLFVRHEEYVRFKAFI